MLRERIVTAAQRKVSLPRTKEEEGKAAGDIHADEEEPTEGSILEINVQNVQCWLNEYRFAIKRHLASCVRVHENLFKKAHYSFVLLFNVAVLTMLIITFFPVLEVNPFSDAPQKTTKIIG